MWPLPQWQARSFCDYQFSSLEQGSCLGASVSTMERVSVNWTVQQWWTWLSNSYINKINPITLSCHIVNQVVVKRNECHEWNEYSWVYILWLPILRPVIFRWKIMISHSSLKFVLERKSLPDGNVFTQILFFFVKSFKFSAIKTFQLQFVPILACISYLNLFDFRIESTTVEDKSANHGWEKINNWARNFYYPSCYVCSSLHFVHVLALFFVWDNYKLKLHEYFNKNINFSLINSWPNDFA